MILGAVRSNDRPARSGWGVKNGIRADPYDFTVAYGSGTWVHMHDTWVL
jgi:hypothetical protein